MRRVLLFVVLLAGCSFNPIKERQLLFTPEPLNSPATKQTFVDNYAHALAAVQADTNPGTLVTYVDAGNALNARNCSEWITRVSLAKRGLLLSDHNLGVVSALTTAIAGLAEWNPTAVAALGAAQVAVQGFSTNLQTDVLGAPSQHQAQSTIFGLQATCADQLLADAPFLRFSQAYSRLEACARVCSYDAAAAAADSALATTPIVVQPSGALKAVRP